MDGLDATARQALAEGRRLALLEPLARATRTRVPGLPLADAIGRLADRLATDGIDACGDEVQQLTKLMEAK